MPNKDDIIKQLSEENAALRKEIKKATKTSELLGVFKRAVKRNLHEFFVREDKIKNVLQENQRLQKELEKKEDELNREKAANVFLSTKNDTQKNEKINSQVRDCDIQHDDASLLPQNKDEAINKYFSSINLTETIKNMPFTVPETNDSAAVSPPVSDSSAVNKNITTQANQQQNKNISSPHIQYDKTSFSDSAVPVKPVKMPEKALEFSSENPNKNKPIVQVIKKDAVKVKSSTNKNNDSSSGVNKTDMSSKLPKETHDSMSFVKKDTSPKLNTSSMTENKPDINETFMQPITFDIKLDQETIPDIEVPDIGTLPDLDDMMKDEKRIWDDDDI